MMDWKRVPTAVYVIATVAFLLSGPVVVFSFLLGGSTAGVVAVLGVFFFFVALYIVVVRRYSES